MTDAVAERCSIRVRGPDAHLPRRRRSDSRPPRRRSRRRQRATSSGLVGVSGSGKSTLLQLDRRTRYARRRRDRRRRPRPRAACRAASGRSFAAKPWASSSSRSFSCPRSRPRRTSGSRLRCRASTAAAATSWPPRRSIASACADRRDHRPGQLSVGQQQRVAVARAIVHEPPVLLADEPTANLDRATAAQLMELFAQLNADLGTTIVMVTHDEQLAGRFCRRTVGDGRWPTSGRRADRREASIDAGAPP